MTKQQTFDALTEQLSATIDALGMPIDRKILPLVIALNALGMETSGSCEGHNDDHTPYVDLDLTISRDQQQQALQALREAETQEAFQRISADEIQNLRAHANELYYNLNKPALKLRYRISRYLERFYQQHNAEYQKQLVITSMSAFGCIQSLRLENQGAAHFALQARSEKTRILTCYQAEMQAFADFLHHCYWTEDSSLTETILISGAHCCVSEMTEALE